MKMDEKKVGSVDVLSPTAALVDAEASIFTSRIKTLAETPSPRFVLEMSEVPYIDSETLEGLLDTADMLRERNQRLKIASLTSTCREILQLTGTAGEFEIFNDVQDAVKSYL